MAQFVSQQFVYLLCVFLKISYFKFGFICLHIGPRGYSVFAGYIGGKPMTAPHVKLFHAPTLGLFFRS